MTKYIGRKRQIDSKIQRYTTNYSDAKNLIDFLGGRKNMEERRTNAGGTFVCWVLRTKTSLPQKLSREL